MTSRRDFLKGLFAAAVATQMPDITPARAMEVADQLALNLNIRTGSGECAVTRSGVEDWPAREGWFKAWLEFTTPPGDEITLVLSGEGDDEMSFEAARADSSRYIAEAVFRPGDGYVDISSVSLRCTEGMPYYGGVAITPHNIVVTSEDPS